MARTANQTRVYLVKRGTVETLVRAPSKSGAIAFVSRDVSATVATQEEIIAGLTAGARVEEVAPETPHDDTPDAAPKAAPQAPAKPAKGKK